MANWYVSSAGWTAVTAWAATTVYTVGQIRRQLAAPTAGQERCFRVTTGGTSGGTEPTWVLTLNGTTNDGSVVWTECTGQEAYQSAGNWTAPAANLQVIMNSGAGNGRGAVFGDDNVFLDAAGSETWNADVAWILPQKAVCVTVAGSALPPTSASLASGYSVTTTGNFWVSFGRSGSFNGVTFNIGSGGGAASLEIAVTGAGGTMIFENCAIKLNTTGGSSRIFLGTTAQYGNLILNNTSLSFGNAGQSIQFRTPGSVLSWFNTPLNGIQGTSPTNLINNSNIPTAEINGVDLSGLTGAIMQVSSGSNVFVGQVRVTGCKLNAATTLAANLRIWCRSNVLMMTGSDDTAGNNVVTMVYGAVAATNGIKSNRTVYRTGGATAGTGNPYSLVIGASSAANTAPTYLLHPVTPPIYFWNETIGSSRTVTVNAIANKSALPTNAMLWMDVQYLASSASPQLTDVTSGPTSTLTLASPTSLAATTEAWDAGVTARANSTAYALDATIKVASNPGRVFFCITAGTSAGSEPAGYASAVDGGSVVDGTATFRAGWRVSAALTFTPQKVGWFSCYVHLIDSQATVTNVYVDAKAEVT